MISLSSLFFPELVAKISDAHWPKKKILEHISKSVCAFEPEIKYHTILAALQKRERIGHTALGHGLAIPHARIPDLSQPLCPLLVLENSTYFDVDEKFAVDIIFCLLIPCDNESEHLPLLAALTKKLQNTTCREQLRAPHDDFTLYNTAMTLFDE